jgi:serine/threonine protein kinase/tetratricopeptide (TPR) repeat protein
VSRCPTRPRTYGRRLHQAPTTGVFAAEPADDLTGNYRAGEVTSGATACFVPQPADARPSDTSSGRSIRSLSRQPLGTKRQRQGDATGAGAPEAGPAVLDLPTGRYQLDRFFAKGGMGEIWVAQDQDVGRSVALKRMRAGADAEQKDLFLREAQITGQLEHPGVVPVHELGEDENGEPFYVMKFIQGRTLTKAIAEYHAPPTPGAPSREVLELRLLQTFLNLCQTVAFAHAQRIIHRDLKPDNVMVGAYGETLLLDWGLAKTIDEADTPGTHTYVHYSQSGEALATLDGAIKGTPTYMSPEVAEGRVADIDETSDIYLLGGTLYHILTNKPPREARKVSKLIDLARNHPPAAPRELDPRIPRPLEAICMKAMAHRREDRYPSAQAITEDLQRYLAGEPVSAYRENWWERTLRWVKKHRVAITRTAVTLAVVGLVIGLVLFGANELQKAEERAEEARIENERKLKAEEEKTKRAKKEADDLQHQKKAADAAIAFRRAADETQRLFALEEPGTDNLLSPGSDQTERKAEEAIANLEPWRPTLTELPLPAADRTALAQQLYGVTLLLAESRSRRGTRQDAAVQTLKLLDQAAALRTPTAAHWRLQADCRELAGDKDQAAAARRLADAKETPVAALDWFLAAERLRVAHVRATQGRDKQTWTDEQHKLLDDAVAGYRRAIALDYNDFWSHFQLGTCYLLLRKEDLALNSLDACVALRPDSMWGYLLRGHLLALTRQFAAARNDFERAMQLDPSRREPQLQRGVVNWLQKRYDAALADFDAVLAPPADQRLIEAAFYRGQLHLERGAPDKAFKDFTMVIEERTGGHPASLRRARIHFARGDVKEGMADLNAFLTGGKSLDPQSPQLYAERGRRLRLMVLELPRSVRKEHLQLALSQLQTAIERGARDFTVYDELGAVLEFLGRVAEAITAYTEAVQVQPKEARLLVKRAWAHEKLSAYREAEADFAAALQLEPSHAEAHAGLAYILACRGKATTGASAHALEAALHSPGDYLVLHNVACVFGKLAELQPNRAREHEDLVLVLLRRELELWQRDHAGPDPGVLIRDEPAFGGSLRQRPEFRKLIDDGR